MSPHNEPETVRTFYDGRAAGYEARYGHHQPFIEFARCALESAWPGMRVLDIGCGPGHLTRDLRPNVAVVGTDLSPAMIELARAGRPTGRFVVHDFHSPLPDLGGKFDVILASGAFDFCEEIDQVVASVGEALRPGGRFYFTVAERRPDLPTQSGRHQNLYPPPQPPLFMYFWSREEVGSAVAKAGLQVNEYRFSLGWSRPPAGPTFHYGYWTTERPA